MKLFRKTKTVEPAADEEALVPIEGVSMALFAELCARMARVDDDPDTFARIAAQHGVARPAWEAARAGWTARMENPATARHIVVPYMAMYQAALAEHGGPAASATYEQYIEMSAMINTSTTEPRRRPNELEPMYAAFGITVIDWSQISTYWVDRIRTDSELGADFAKRMKARMDELDAQYLASLPVDDVAVAS